MTLAFVSLAPSFEASDSVPPSGVRARKPSAPALSAARRAELKNKRLALSLLGSVCRSTDRVYRAPGLV